jgi:hypothetical protein
VPLDAEALPRYCVHTDNSIGDRMSSKKGQKEYLQKAQEAEEQAAKSRDISLRDSWLKMAEAYRRLAQGDASQNTDEL